MQDINLKQICKILEENQIPSSHDGRHHVTMDHVRHRVIRELIVPRLIVHKVQAQKVYK
jgi:hypothetical protein